EGDMTNGEGAFLKVRKMDPRYADGWVNVARARVQQGNMEDAEPMLRKALEIDPHLAKTHFFLGTALKSLGRYDESITHLREAASQYPRDRVVQNQLGRVLFLKRDFKAALQPFHPAVPIDPSHLPRHSTAILT